MEVSFREYFVTFVSAVTLAAASATPRVARTAPAIAPCDAQITRPSSGAFGYQQRGDRCEGIYEQPTSASAEPTTFKLISFTCGAPPSGFARNMPATVGWTDAGSSAIALRVETLPEVSLRYRMDARPTSDSPIYTWPSDLLAALSIAPQELSLLILGAPKIGDVTLPGTVILAAFEGSPAPCTATPRAGFYTRHAIVELRVCAKDIAATDAAALTTAICETFEQAYVPSESISVPLQMLTQPGLYELSVEGRRTTGPLLPREYFKVSTR